jgi:protein-glutamine gamma-glutamyltransferase
MSRKAREVETILLTMLAALPLYFTQAVNPLVVGIFHLALAAIAASVLSGRGPELIPRAVQSAAAIAYFVFYAIDAVALSRSLIAASTHLLLFIAVYQPMESIRVRNQGQRLLITFLIFVSSIATATHISILIFVCLFAFMMFRQLMYLSHVASVQSVDRDYVESPLGRAAAFYLFGTAVIALMLFPLLPRIRNPFIHGGAGALNNATTGLSDAIDFNQERTITKDPAVVARVWMSRQAVAFFGPVRMRATIYEIYERNTWKQPRRVNFQPVIPRRGEFRIGDSSGFSGDAIVQQSLMLGGRLFLPSGTWKVRSVPQLYEGPTHDIYTTFAPPSRDLLSYGVSMTGDVLPLNPIHPQVTNYPVTPKVAALARQIVGQSAAPLPQAAKIEAYMSSKFQYVPDPSKIGHTMSTDDFLLRFRRGHCEYFAAGMVALMTALDVPARIVGGFYGGQLNPLTGYFVVRKEDAHAWVEIFDGKRWRTFDPTPATLRPGNAAAGLVGLYATAISDSINYFWDRYVLTFGLGDQEALATELFLRLRSTLRQWIGDWRLARYGTIAGVHGLFSLRTLVIAALIGLCGAFAITIIRKRPSIFDELSAQLADLSIVVGPATTMEEALARLRLDHAEAARALQPLIEMYEEEQFSGRASAERRTAIRRRLAELRRA